jgi:hypothetical protein
MHSPLKLALVAGLASILGTATAAQSMAQSRPSVPPSPYLAYSSQPYNEYQASDGSYYSLSDYVRSVEGTPCGVNCTDGRLWSR